ncbi:MAG: CcdB family protein [Pseudomonadota bacterium]
MRQYGAYRLKNSANTVIVLQYPSLETSSLVIVAPLIDAAELPEITPITPILEHEDKTWMVLAYRMAAVPESELGEFITHFRHADYLIHRALSRLFFGN